jgi:drug/metabolite transporter (DMT)-like permease
MPKAQQRLHMHREGLSGPANFKQRQAFAARRAANADCATLSAMRPGSSIISGAGAALLAALSFGVTAPLIARAGQHVGPLTIAALLYAGAAASSLLPRSSASSAGAPLERAHAWRLLAMAIVGAGLAPTLLAWGLRRTGGVTGSLLLNLEAPFTVLIAWLIYREPIGRRVAAALVLMTLGGCLLAFGASAGAPWSVLSVLAIAAATLAWGVDNTLSRGLAQQDPLQVIAIKGSLGALATGACAYGLSEQLPSARDAALLLVCGASGYGLSLRLYLRAQRQMGAARTGSIFAVAPFIGAAVGLAWGERLHGPSLGVAAAAFAAGLWLHLTERHEHQHVHEAVEHEHPHRHDDGHHQHAHDPPFYGEHSHAHQHDRLEHDHDHAPDLHHDHEHC